MYSVARTPHSELPREKQCSQQNSTTLPATTQGSLAHTEQNIWHQRLRITEKYRENALRLKQCETASTLAGRLPEFCFLVAYETRHILCYLIPTELTRTNISRATRYYFRNQVYGPRKSEHFTASSHRGGVQNRIYLPNTHMWQLTSELVQSR